MNKIFNIIWKNVLILINSKSSGFILIIGPLFLILLSGLVLSGSEELKEVKIGMYVSENNELENLLINKFQEKNFLVEKFNNKDNCIESVKQDINNICVELVKKEGKEKNKYIGDKLNYKAIFYLDFSKQRIVWTIMSVVEGVIKKESSSISNNMTETMNSVILESSEQLRTKRYILDDVLNTGNSIKSDINNADNNLKNLDLKPENVDQLGLDRIENNIIIIRSQLSPIYEYKLYNNMVSLENEVKTTRSLAIEIKDNLREANNVRDSSRDYLGSADDQVDSVLSDVNGVKSKLDDIDTELKEIKRIDFKDVTNPLPVEYKSISGEDTGTTTTKLRLIDYLVPSFIIVFIMFISIIFATTLVIEERKSRSFIRNLVSPTPNFIFSLGTYLTCAFFISIQTIILLFVSSFFINIKIMKFFLPIFLFLFLVISLFVLLGMFLGYLFDSKETAILGAISISVIFLLFSSFITPLETLSQKYANIITYTPFVLFETISRKIIIFQMGIIDILSNLMFVFIYIFILIVSILCIRKWRTKYDVL